MAERTSRSDPWRRSSWRLSCRLAALGLSRWLSLIHDPLTRWRLADQGEPLVLVEGECAVLSISAAGWAKELLRVRSGALVCSRRGWWLWGESERCAAAARRLRIRAKPCAGRALPAGSISPPVPTSSRRFSIGFRGIFVLMAGEAGCRPAGGWRHPRAALRRSCLPLGHLPSTSAGLDPNSLGLPTVGGLAIVSSERPVEFSHLPARRRSGGAFLLDPRGSRSRKGKRGAAAHGKTVLRPRRLADYIGQAGTSRSARHRRGSHPQPRRGPSTTLPALRPPGLAKPPWPWVIAEELGVALRASPVRLPGAPRDIVGLLINLCRPHELLFYSSRASTGSTGGEELLYPAMETTLIYRGPLASTRAPLGGLWRRSPWGEPTTRAGALSHRCVTGFGPDPAAGVLMVSRFQAERGRGRRLLIWKLDAMAAARWCRRCPARSYRQSPVAPGCAMWPGVRCQPRHRASLVPKRSALASGRRTGALICQRPSPAGVRSRAMRRAGGPDTLAWPGLGEVRSPWKRGWWNLFFCTGLSAAHPRGSGGHAAARQHSAAGGGLMGVLAALACSPTQLAFSPSCSMQALNARPGAASGDALPLVGSGAGARAPRRFGWSQPRTCSWRFGRLKRVSR